MRLRYLFWRWLAPKLPTRRLRDWAWAHKWALWHTLYGPHERLWAEPMGTRSTLPQNTFGGQHEGCAHNG
jgi:hypothetical protein